MIRALRLLRIFRVFKLARYLGGANVRYGDLTPQTVLGKVLSAVAMIAGYSIIAVPTGIVSAEIVHATRPTTRVCPSCLSEGHEASARYCKDCGIAMS